MLHGGLFSKQKTVHLGLAHSFLLDHKRLVTKPLDVTNLLPIIVPSKLAPIETQGYSEVCEILPF